VKKSAFKVVPSGSGFIRTTLAPINSKRDSKFGLWETFEVVALVGGITLIMRFLLAH
jgi:hypothetical protein